MTRRPRGPRPGVTVIEVMFAMLVALVGLMGVLAIVPLASRQASDSYALTHAAGAALNSAATIAASDVIRPTAKRPWCFDDDTLPDSRPQSPSSLPPVPLEGQTNDFRYKPVDSVRYLYQGLKEKAEARLGIVSNPNPLPIWRQVYGQGFCFDPIYYASVNLSNYASADWVHIFDPATHIIRRTRLPFVSEQFDLKNENLLFGSYLSTANGSFPVTSPNTSPSLGARLIRLSAWSQYVEPSMAMPQGRPVRRSVADQIVSALGDTIGAELAEDKSFGAIREFEGGGSGPLLSSETRTNISWLATLVPMETLDDSIPSHFTLSIAMIKSRERFIELPDLTLKTTVEMPEYERVAMVSAPLGPPTLEPGKFPVGGNPVAPVYPPTQAVHLPESRGGVLTVTLTADSRTDAQLRVGEHVLLSRTIRNMVPDHDINGDRFIHRHRWYRIIGLDGGESWPRRVTLQGPAWDYPEFASRAPSSITGAELQEARTTATIIPDVVAVFEIPITIDNES